MDRIQLKLLIFLMHLTYIFSIVVFPFKIPEEKEKTLRFSNDIHATTYLGEPEQLTNIFFTSEEFLYFLDSCEGYNNFIKNFSTYETSKFPIYVDDDDDESGKVRAYEVNETIYIYTDLELTQKEKISDFPFLILTTERSVVIENFSHVAYRVIVPVLLAFFISCSSIYFVPDPSFLVFQPANS